MAAGQKLIGYKVGLTSKAMQRSSQIDEPDYGYLFDDMLIADGAKVAHADYCRPRVEVELAFVMGKALKGPGVTLTDVLRATEYVVPALEIVDARIQDPRKIFDTVADNGAAAAIVMGGRPVRPMDVDLRWVGGIMYVNSEIEETGLAAGVPAIRRWASMAANKLGENGMTSSRAMWCWPVRSPAWCSPRRATRCTAISGRSAAFPFNSSEGARPRKVGTGFRIRIARPNRATPKSGHLGSGHAQKENPMDMPRNAFKHAIAKGEVQIGLWCSL